VTLEAAGYDWPTAYNTVNTATLLGLLPQLRLVATPKLANPHQ
jgi:hypothetical protein